jgi:Tol biopolymer transport system component
VAPDGELAVVTLDQSAEQPARHTLLGVRARNAIAVVDDWLLYVSSDGRRILAVQFDRKGRRAIGEPVSVLNVPSGSIADAQLARNGTLLYTRHLTRNAPVLVDSSGVQRPMFAGVGGSFMDPRLSPDGRRLVIQRGGRGGTNAWVFDDRSPTGRQLTTAGSVLHPTWTPDGERIVYLSLAKGRQEVWTQRADSGATPEPIVAGSGLVSVDVAPDGRTIVFQQQIDSLLGIWSARIGGDGRAQPVVVGGFNAYMPAVSPDGRWLAYVSNESGRNEIYVRAFPNRGAAVQISDSGGVEPVWSRDGRRIYFRRSPHMMEATIVTRPAIAVAKRVSVFTGSFDHDEMPMPHRNFDVTADGKQFVMIATMPDAMRETVVVLGWHATVEQRLTAVR